MAKVTVADSAPLIALACIGQLDLLPRVLGEVLVPDTVATECLRPSMPGVEAIASAFTGGILIHHADIAVPEAVFPQLDAGESAAIRLAQVMNAAVLMDERLGRAVARRLGLPVIGSLGVLIAAKRSGLLVSLKTAIDQMQDNGYYMAEALIREALHKAGE